MVHFIGAGCGAPDLITLRGARLLGEADVIIYAGSLVNPALLDNKKASCTVYNSALMTLNEVIAVMEQAHKASQTVVRLHTGDPSLYGAIREQMDRLSALSIPFDVCPGVSALSGAAASLQAEYTLPAVSQSVIITRMAGRTPVPDQESIRSFAAHGATMVIFLSAGMTEALQQELLSGGYTSETPAAIVYKASWPDEKVLRCTVGTLHKTAAENSITNLALITVGGFLGKNYDVSKLYDAAFTTAFRKGRDA
ncbi:MAG: precorrin-4 C(11)-methyltransferase [Clostridiales bacterium]|nr:precorrin-4 C(11)-methyltransferase [Clostridiales bacterium]